MFVCNTFLFIYYNEEENFFKIQTKENSCQISTTLLFPSHGEVIAVYYVEEINFHN